MKTVNLSNILKAIKFTVTRDGRVAAGKFNYYEDATMDAVLSNPTSHFMLNGSLSLPSVAYLGSEKTGALELNNGHYAVYVGSTSQITALTLPEPSAAVLHRTYLLVNQKETTVPVAFTTGGNTTSVVTLSALPSPSASITTVANLPINSVVVQCQRTSRALATPQIYTWRIMSANYAPSVGAEAPATQYYGGTLQVNLKRTTGVSISASILSQFITITSNGSAGIPQTGNSNQIIRQFTAGESANVSIASALPSGYSFSYWQQTSPPAPASGFYTASASQPFNQELAGSSTNPNATITAIDLFFAYSAPATSSTYSYSGGGGGGGGVSGVNYR